MVELLDQITDLTCTGAEPERPIALVPEDAGELGGLTNRGAVVVPGAVRAAAVDYVARGRGLDAGETGTGVVGGGLEIHGRTMRPVRQAVESARNSRRTRNSRRETRM